jgi:L-ascorbate oxidase
VNGKNWAECNQTVLDGLGYGTQCDQACTYSNIEIEPDKTYLFRFVAASVDTFAGIAIQEHNMTLVQVDGGSWLEPFETNYLEMHSGQRYAVIIKGKSVEELSQSEKLTYVRPSLQEILIFSMQR